MNQPQSLCWRGPWRHLADRDVWHSLSVSALAVLASGGLLWLFFLFRTVQLARRAAAHPQRARTVLLFGKRLQAERPDADYEGRIARAHDVLRRNPAPQLLLLGGRTGSGPSEAAAALQRLQQLGLDAGARVQCEDASTDTLENLRNARDLLGGDASAPVGLISSRYHLARCLLLARSLGLDAEVIAAEAQWRWSPPLLGRLALEASYCLWFATGRRWARLIGNQRMLQRVS